MSRNSKSCRRALGREAGWIIGDCGEDHGGFGAPWRRSNTWMGESQEQRVKVQVQMAFDCLASNCRYNAERLETIQAVVDDRGVIVSAVIAGDGSPMG